MITFGIIVIFIFLQTSTCLLLSGGGCNIDCGHHGSCQWYGHWYCRCNDGWQGERCDQSCKIDCHHGTCHWSHSGNHWYCQCNNGWMGDHCDQNFCTSSPCGKNGNCDAHTSTCSCHAGYSGTHCEVDLCASNPCQHDGQCHGKHTDRGYECSCRHHYTGDFCEVPPTTSTSTTSTTTTTTTTTTPTTSTTTTNITTTKTTTTTPTTTTITTTGAPSFTTQCSKLETVFDLAEKVIQTNHLAATCPSGNHSSHEAFVLNVCHLAIPSAWKQGYNVMTLCDKIPPYTPIASFENGKYSSAGSRSGIFIGCLHGLDGFKAAFQRCDEVAKIESIMVGDVLFNNNPYNYYTLKQ